MKKPSLSTLVLGSALAVTGCSPDDNLVDPSSPDKLTLASFSACGDTANTPILSVMIEGTQGLIYSALGKPFTDTDQNSPFYGQPGSKVDYTFHPQIDEAPYYFAMLPNSGNVRFTGNLNTKWYSVPKGLADVAWALTHGAQAPDQTSFATLDFSRIMITLARCKDQNICPDPDLDVIADNMSREGVGDSLTNYPGYNCDIKYYVGIIETP